MDKVRICILWGIPRRDADTNIVRYCDFLGEDRLSFLVRTTKEDIITFPQGDHGRSPSSPEKKYVGWMLESVVYVIPKIYWQGFTL